MNEQILCDQRKENEHLPQLAEQHCLRSFPFFVVPHKNILSSSAPNFCYSHSKAKISQPHTLTLEFMQSTLSHRNIFNCFSRRIQHFQCSPPAWCLLRELLKSQNLQVSCSFASAHHLPLSQHPTLAIQE